MLWLCGCGLTDVEQSGPPVQYVGVTGERHGILTGQTTQFTAQGLDSLWQVVSQGPAIWSISDSSVASVDAHGLVTGLSAGHVYVNAQIDTAHGQASLYVLDSVASIALEAPTRAVVPLASFVVLRYLLSTHGDTLGPDYRMLEWHTTDPAVATVNDDGRVVAVAPGTATIVLKATDERVSASVGVTVITLTYRTVQYNGGTNPTFACALTTDGEPYCWGINLPGQLYTEDYVPFATGRPVPTHLDTDLRFDSLTVGGDHVCALTEQGVGYCWGGNGRGQLGDGTRTTSWAPVAVVGGLTFREIRAGHQHTCGVAPDGAAYCWGANDDGAFGNDNTISSDVPVPAVNGIALQSISLSRGTWSWSAAHCGMTTTGVAYCWGRNELGQVGNGTRSPDPTPPAVVQSPVPLVAVRAGAEHACGLAADGTALCWGNGAQGELARPLDYPGIDSVPGPVVGGPTYATLALGLYRSCGVTSDGAVWCWGFNWSDRPLEADLPEPMAEVRVSVREICGISTSQVAYCWSLPSESPTRVLGQPPAP
jgi:alpha-tubulin suppressor-like RCC1 family protein